MASDSSLRARLDELVTLFHRRSLDLPDGLFDRRAQFRLNGIPFETMFGRSGDDPLILMLTRGPAGYRFVVKAVQHAVPDVRLERGEFDAGIGGQAVARGQCWLSGHLRGTGEAVHDRVDIELGMSAAGSVEVASVTLPEDALVRLREARLRP